MKFLFLPIAAATLVSPAVPVNPKWGKAAAPFTVIGPVHYVGSAGLSSWLITTSKGAILLDVGMADNAPMVEDSIKALGYKLTDVKILLNSHAHLDHSGGLARLKADTGAKLIASAGDRPALERGVYIGSESNHMLDFPPVKVDRIVADGGKVTLGGVTLTAMITSGHSPGCTNYQMTVTEAGTPHKVFFFCSATVAANRLAPDPQYPGIVADYRRTFARLKNLDADVFLGPHDNFFDLDAKRAKLRPGAANPFIVPGEGKRVIADMALAFEKALADQTARAK